MANQLMTSSNELTAIVPEIWSQRLFETLRETLPFLQSVNMDYEGEIRDMGDIVNISEFPQFSDAGLLAEGAAGDASAITVQNTQLNINNRPYKDFIVTKKAQLQSLPMMDKLRDLAAFSINKKIQQIIIDAIVPSAAAPDHQIAYDSGTTLQLADILEAKELLLAQSVPQDEGLSMVVGSAQWADLYNISGFTSRDFVPAGSPLSSGEFAVPIVGFTPRFTSVVGNTSYFFHSSFLTLAIQQELQVEAISMGADGVRATRVNSDVLMGVAQLDNLRVVSIS